MRVEIWSDVVCPWCYIGKRRFEAALANFAHKEQVEVIWRSYQLDPDAPTDSQYTVDERLAHKYGVSVSQAAAMNERVSSIAAKEGLEYHLEQAKYGNSFDAHRLIHLAASYGLQHEAEERLFKAYFTEGRTLTDAETLVQLIAEVGIDADQARSVLRSDEYTGDVRADERHALALGITGVPFFVFAERYGVSGAQPVELFAQVLEQAWSESCSASQVASSDTSGSCGEDSCDIG